MAPEVLQDQPCTLESDIWSLGVTVHQMCTLKRPYSSAKDIAALKVCRQQPLDPSGDQRTWMRRTGKLKRDERPSDKKCCVRDGGQRDERRERAHAFPTASTLTSRL
eukprot:8303516-Pyramimonas_sp.AAC.2